MHRHLVEMLPQCRFVRGYLFHRLVDELFECLRRMRGPEVLEKNEDSQRVMVLGEALRHLLVIDDFPDYFGRPPFDHVQRVLYRHTPIEVVVVGLRLDRGFADVLARR